MKQRLKRGRWLLLACLALAPLALTGCVRQPLNLSSIKQVPAPPGAALTHFADANYEVYLLADLIPVKRVEIDTIMRRVNPQGKPVANLLVTSQEDGWATLVNWLNGAAYNRGWIVSLNKVSVEGDLVQ